MVEKNFRVPAIGVVTPDTHLALLLLMHIIIGMTGDAGGFQRLFLFLRRGMTGLAGQFCMAAVKDEFSIFCVIKTDLSPPLDGVTVVTFPAVHTSMHVIQAVAGVTILFQFFLVQRPFVATVASKLAMPVLQLVFGIAVVIEPDFVPLLGGVALLAFFTKLPAMDVIDLMAKMTLLRCLLVTLTGMAKLALEIQVLAFELVFGVFVVVEIKMLPATLHMTFIALLTQTAAMRIGLLMAVDT